MVRNGNMDDEIAAALGRTANAINLNRKRPPGGAYGDAHAAHKRRPPLCRLFWRTDEPQEKLSPGTLEDQFDWRERAFRPVLVFI